MAFVPIEKHSQYISAKEDVQKLRDKMRAQGIHLAEEERILDELVAKADQCWATVDEFIREDKSQTAVGAAKIVARTRSFDVLMQYNRMMRIINGDDVDEVGEAHG